MSVGGLSAPSVSTARESGRLRGRAGHSPREWQTQKQSRPRYGPDPAQIRLDLRRLHPSCSFTYLACCMSLVKGGEHEGLCTVTFRRPFRCAHQRRSVFLLFCEVQDEAISQQGEDKSFHFLFLSLSLSLSLFTNRFPVISRSTSVCIM